MAISTLASVFRAKCESANTLPFSRPQGFFGRASQVGHLTSCALSFTGTVYVMAVELSLDVESGQILGPTVAGHGAFSANDPFIPSSEPTGDDYSLTASNNNGPAGSTPEPGSIVLFGSGVAGLAGLLGDKRRRGSPSLCAARNAAVTPIGRRGDLCITRKVWEGNLKDPKTQKRQAPVPVIPHLQKAFDAYWKAAGSPAEGWIFTASRGKLPIRMDNLAGREIKPDLKKAGLGWHGWHAFRRGLATNLRELGIPDDVIQRILRHSDIGTTQRSYAKTLTKTVRKAMAKLDRQLIRDKSGTATECYRRNLLKMEALGRVELPTNGLGNRCSIHLSYRAMRS